MDIFLVSGFLGWIILSLFDGKLSGYMWEKYKIPFKPMFAIGASIVYFLTPYIKHWSSWKIFLFYLVFLTLVEFVLFKIASSMGIHFRCYYNNKRYALLYSLYWGISGVVLTQYFSNKNYLQLLLIIILLVVIFRDGRKGFVILDKNPNEIIMC